MSNDLNFSIGHRLSASDNLQAIIFASQCIKTCHTTGLSLRELNLLHPVRYYARKRRGNVSGHICLCVPNALTFESLERKFIFLMRVHLQIFMSNSFIKVIGPCGQGHRSKKSVSAYRVCERSAFHRKAVLFIYENAVSRR